MTTQNRTWRDRADDELGPELAAIRRTRDDAFANANVLLARAKSEAREMTSDEARSFESAMNEIEVLNARLDNSPLPRRSAPAPVGGRPESRANLYSPGEFRSFGKGESIHAHLVETGEIERRNVHPLALGKALVAMVTGGSRSEEESRALNGLSPTAGGYMVSDGISSLVIDAVRARTVAIEAGVRVSPMTSRDMTLIRVTGDPTPGWRNEGGLVASSEPTFGAARMSAKSLACLIPVSKELLDDAANAAEIIQTTLVNALAVELDRAILDGDGITKPLGLRQQTGIGTLAVGGAATTLKFAEAVGKVREANEVPSGIVLHPRTFGAAVDRAVDSTNQPLRLPPSLERMPFLQTTSVPATLGAGTDTVAYVGDWSQLIVGMRTGIQIEIARQASDSNGRGFGRNEVLILASVRADTVLTRATAFSVMTGITN
jgi:HK97 family phage major capsid protein